MNIFTNPQRQNLAKILINTVNLVLGTMAARLVIGDQAQRLTVFLSCGIIAMTAVAAVLFWER